MRCSIVLLAVLGCAGQISSGDYDADADPEDPGEGDELAGLLEGQADGGATDTDIDRDGIPDLLEEQLLRRYRPYYRFSANEQFEPANPIAELTNAQLKIADRGGGTSDPLACGRPSDHHLDPPTSLFVCRPDASLVDNQGKSSYCLNLDNDRYHGVSAADARANATGLYGHVAPTRIGGHDAYKIEYWQFFAFNNQDITVVGLGSFGDHEGDWTSVQVWFDRELHRLVKVRYLIHGKAITFDLPAVSPACTDCTIDVSGPNLDPDPPNILEQPRAYDNNAAQFYIDDHHYKHVVVWIERGGHEFWPGPWGHGQTSFGPLTLHLNPHDGAGPSYLVTDVKDRLWNLGEVEHPLTAAGRLILQYDGMWGCTNTQEVLGVIGPRRRSPVGPALHCSWTWPDGRGPLPGCDG